MGLSFKGGRIECNDREGKGEIMEEDGLNAGGGEAKMKEIGKDGEITETKGLLNV